MGYLLPVSSGYYLHRGTYDSMLAARRLQGDQTTVEDGKLFYSAPVSSISISILTFNFYGVLYSV